MIRQQADCYY